MAFEVGGNKSWHHLHCGASGECSRPTNLNRQMNVVTLIARYPQLYHMAEQGTWPAIQKRGLLSMLTPAEN